MGKSGRGFGLEFIKKSKIKKMKDKKKIVYDGS